MSIYKIEMDMSRNIIQLAKHKCPCLVNMPNSWPALVKFLEEYKPLIKCKVVPSRPPRSSAFKCNSDGTSKRNPEASVAAFYVKKIEWVI